MPQNCSGVNIADLAARLRADPLRAIGAIESGLAPLNKPMTTRTERRYGQRGSLSVRTTDGSFFDHERGEGGDLLALYERVLGRDAGRRRAYEVAGGRCQSATPLPNKRNIWGKGAGRDAEYRRTIAAMTTIWAASSSIDGTLAEHYLRNVRGIFPSPNGWPADVRFNSRLRYKGGRVPGLISAVRDVRTDEVCGFHRIFLSADGEKLDRWTIGRVKNGAVKIDPDDCVTTGLTIAEGVETALAARALGFAPTWSVVSSGGVGAFGPLPSIEALAIFADADAAGRKAAAKCAATWRAAGQEVTIIEPRTEGADANDLLQQVRR